MQQLCVVNAYTPPGSEGVMAEALGMFWERETLVHKRWLLVGDHNQEPQDSLVLDVLRAQGGFLVDTNGEPVWTALAA